MHISFISSIAVIVADPAPSRKLFIDALGLPLQPHEGDEYSTVAKSNAAPGGRRTAPSSLDTSCNAHASDPFATAIASETICHSRPHAVNVGATVRSDCAIFRRPSAPA
jgi:hypothetical protein